MWLLLIQLRTLSKCRPVSRNYLMDDFSIRHFSKLDGSLHSRQSINKFRHCETDEKQNQPSDNNFSSVSIGPPLLSWYKYERALAYAPHGGHTLVALSITNWICKPIAIEHVLRRNGRNERHWVHTEPAQKNSIAKTGVLFSKLVVQIELMHFLRSVQKSCIHLYHKYKVICHFWLLFYNHSDFIKLN